MNFCGVDVSAREVVVVRRQERSEAVRRFANTPAGHKALLGCLLGRSIPRIATACCRARCRNAC
jgi:hypothetical protein